MIERIGKITVLDRRDHPVNGHLDGSFVRQRATPGQFQDIVEAIDREKCPAGVTSRPSSLPLPFAVQVMPCLFSGEAPPPHRQCHLAETEPFGVLNPNTVSFRCPFVTYAVSAVHKLHSPPGLVSTVWCCSR